MEETLYPWTSLRGRSAMSSQHQIRRSLETSGFWITEDKKMWADLCLRRFRYTHGTSANFKVDFNNAISGLQFWIVAEVCTKSLSTWKFPVHVQSKAHDCDLSALNVQVKSTMDKLDEFKSVLGRLGSASDGVEMSIEIAKTISTVNLKSTDALYLTRSR